ncbi:MAG: mechanosensitive ion channel family protein [Actinobacteria bacterium]|nr:mechanosensitive ion channel family protein [Actinomycetota bacterium]
MVASEVFALPGVAVDPQRLGEVCGVHPTTACRLGLEWTDNAFLAHAAQHVIAPALRIVVIWMIAVIVNRVVRRLIRRVGRHLEGAAESDRFARFKAKAPSVLVETGSVSIRAAARAKTTTAVLRSVSSVVVYSIAAIYSLSVIGIRLGPLAAGAGIIGVALGFGAQTMVKDFLAGMFMLTEDQFGVGDVIDVSGSVDGSVGVRGTVEAVTLRITSVRDVNGTIWHIPNGDIRRVGNMSQGWARSLLDVVVPFGTDLDRAEAIIAEVAQRVTTAPEYRSEVLAPPEIRGVEAMDPTSVTIRVVVKTRPGEQWPITRALRAGLHDAFVEAGIKPPSTRHEIMVRPVPESDPPSAG